MTNPVAEKAKPTPGDGAPPSIEAGSFVSWPGGEGRVDIIVTNGKVPGVEDEVEGSKESPAARVTVWEKDGDGYKAGGKKVGAMVQTLKRTAPLQSGKAASGPAGAALISLLAAHEERVAHEGLGETAQVTGTAVKAVYDRGLAAWPGMEATGGVSREGWAEKRVSAFLSVAAGKPLDGYTRDLGLLAKSHPLHPENKVIVDVKPTDDGGVDLVTVDISDLEATLASFNAPSAE